MTEHGEIWIDDDGNRWIYVDGMWRGMCIMVPFEQEEEL